MDFDLDTVYDYLMVGGMILLALFGLVVVFFMKPAKSSIDPYRKIFNLKNANMEYSADLERIKGFILPSRRSVFSGQEPEVLLYNNGETQLYLGAINKGEDVRIWMQPTTVLENVHIVLDGSQNNTSGKSNVLKYKLPQQCIDLEGNFPDYFKLYCNEQQQVIALQIVAPDIMSYILDNLMSVDIEIIDNQVGIISRGATLSVDSFRATIELAEKIGRIVRATQKVTSL